MTNASKKSKAAEPRLSAQPPETSPDFQPPSSERTVPQGPITQAARAPGPLLDTSRPPGFGPDQSSAGRPPAQPTRPFGLPPDASRLQETGTGEPTQSSGSTFAGASQRRHSSSSDIYEPETELTEDVARVDPDELQRSRQKLDSFVDQFRSSHISKSKALTRIADLIDDSPSLSDIEKDKTLKLYMEELESSIRDVAEPDFLKELRNK